MTLWCHTTRLNIMRGIGASAICASRPWNLFQFYLSLRSYYGAIMHMQCNYVFVSKIEIMYFYFAFYNFFCFCLFASVFLFWIQLQSKILPKEFCTCFFIIYSLLCFPGHIGRQFLPILEQYQRRYLIFYFEKTKISFQLY